MTEAVSWRQTGERYFRWRGKEVTRVEGFSDAVFALILALLAVQSVKDIPWEGLSHLPEQGADLCAFAATFAIVAMIWHSHFVFFRRYGLRDFHSMFLNYVLLFLVACYAYPLRYLFGTLSAGLLFEVPGVRIDADWTLLMRIYSVGFGGIYLMLVLLYVHAWRCRDELELDEVERYTTRIYITMHGVMVGFAVLSIALAGISPPAAGWIYGLIGPVLGVHGYFAGRRHAQLVERHASHG